MENAIGRYRNFIASLFLFVVLTLSFAIFLPPVRNFVRQNMLILYFGTAVIFTVGFSLIILTPPAVSEEVPSALSVKD